MIIFLHSCRNLVRIRQEFRNIGFYKVICCWVNFETCQIVFYFINASKFLITLFDFFRVYDFIRDCFNKILLVKFYHSSVYFCCLKCGTNIRVVLQIACVRVVGSQYPWSFLHGSLSDSLINYDVIF